MQPHLIAQRLNNSAALCIEAGHYDRAVSTLVEALKLADHCGGGGGGGATTSSCCSCCDEICQCRACSLDECIVFSDSAPPLMLARNKSKNNNDDDGCGGGSGSGRHDEGYVHRRPIRVTPRSLHEGHNMGVTLSLIITFNIALAHHLSAISEAVPSRGKLRKILHLYELAYKWQAELEDSNDYAVAQQRRWESRNNITTQWTSTNHHGHRAESSIVTSLRFNMIICNNLSQIHRLVDNKRKSIRCLEHLLRSVMFVVDTTATNGGEGGRHSMMELDGFLQNATSLILQEQCAGAA